MTNASDDLVERQFMLQDDNRARRPAIDIAREIVADGDQRGSAARHSTTILTRQVIDTLCEEITSLRAKLAVAEAKYEELEKEAHSDYKSLEAQLGTVYTKLATATKALEAAEAAARINGEICSILSRVAHEALRAITETKSEEPSK